MTTDELERVLATALHAGDETPIDVDRGLVRLERRREARRLASRRLTLAAVAASVLVVTLATALALGQLRGPHGRDVTPAPAITLSPSGLPIGLLKGSVADPDNPGRIITVRLWVRADGTAAWDDGGGAMDERTTAFEIRLEAAGRHHATVRYDSATCPNPHAATLGFTLRARRVVLDTVRTTGCLISVRHAEIMTGMTLQVLPLPIELSPSGLPVGLLKGSYAIGRDVGTLRLLVRSDGKGQLEFTEEIHHGQTDPYEVSMLGTQPGRVVLRYDGTGCSTPTVLTLDYTLGGDRVTITRATAPGRCLISTTEAAAMTGATLRRFDPPAGDSLGAGRSAS